MTDDLRNLLQIARLIVVIAFVVLGFRVVRTTDAVARRRAINVLIIFVLAVNAVVALVPTDSWPFSPYPMMAVDATDRTKPHSALSLRAVDTAGQEWPVDPLAYSPLFPQAIMGWFEVVNPSASKYERHEVMRFLLVRAEDARQRRVQGERFFGNSALLGPLAAPDSNLYGPRPPFSANRYVKLRLYRLRWTPLEFFSDRSRLERTLVLDVSE
jgi:hypothetical protein